MSVIAAAVVGSAVVGAAATSQASKSASKSQAASTKAVTQSADYAADLSYLLGQDQLAFGKEQFNYMKPLAERVTNAQLGMMNENQRQAQDYYNYQMATFRPLEQGLVSQAQNYNTEAMREQLASKAAADAGRAFNINRGAMERSMASMGVNPNSGKFAAMANQNALGLAAQRAGAMTGARQQAEQLGWAKQLDAAGLGRNLAGASNAAYGTAGTMGNSAVQNGLAPGNQMIGAMTNANGTMMQGALANTNAMLGLAQVPNQSASLWGAMGGTLMGAGIQGAANYYGLQALGGKVT